jgi:hypothetical protein
MIVTEMDGFQVMNGIVQVLIVKIKSLGMTIPQMHNLLLILITIGNLMRLMKMTTMMGLLIKLKTF